MALTDIIEADLLATLAADSDPQAVLDRYAGSKGPLYAALARATVQATGRFVETRQKLRDAQARRRTAEDEAGAAEKRADQVERRAKAADKRLAEATTALQAQQDLLDRATALRDAGFDDGSLIALARAFTQVAQTAGITPAEAVARFLEAATDFEGIATFERQAADAEARAKNAEAGAHERERNAKVREVAVAWAEWFVRRRITEKTVAAWQAVGQALGLTAEDLAEGLADALERFGALEAVIQAKTGERDALAVEITKLTAANATLREEQTTIRAALEAVAQEGRARIARMEKTATAAIAAERAQAQAAMANLDTRMAAALDKLASLDREAAELEKFVGWARALASRNPDNWREVEPDAWAAMMWHLGRWIETVGVNPDVPLPAPLRSRVEDQAKYPSLYGPVRVPLLGLTAWLTEGLQAVPAAAVLALAAGNGQGRADGRV